MNPISIQEVLAAAIDYKKCIGIYFLVYKNEIVYVGQSTGNVHSRIHIHATLESKKFDKYHWIECDLAELDDIEADLIVTLNPIHNSTIPPNKKWVTFNVLKRRFDTGTLQLKRYIKLRKIKDTNGYYDLADFLEYRGVAE